MYTFQTLFKHSESRRKGKNRHFQQLPLSYNLPLPPCLKRVKKVWGHIAFSLSVRFSVGSFVTHFGMSRSWIMMYAEFWHIISWYSLRNSLTCIFFFFGRPITAYLKCSYIIFCEIFLKIIWLMALIFGTLFSARK